MAYIIVLLVFPLTYYLTSPEFYYRRPLDPMMVALAVYAVMPSRGPDELPLDEQGSLAVAEDDQLEPELAERV